MGWMSKWHLMCSKKKISWLHVEMTFDVQNMKMSQLDAEMAFEVQEMKLGRWDGEIAIHNLWFGRIFEIPFDVQETKLGLFGY